MSRPKLCSTGDGRRASRRGLCQACVRAAGPARTPDGQAGQVSLRLPASWLRAVEAAAGVRKVTSASWLREAVHRALVQEGWTNPDVREAVRNALEPS